MSDDAKPAPPPATPEELSRMLEILDRLVADRTRLLEVPEDQRVALLMAAGRLSRPQRHEMRREAKAFRKVEKKQKKDTDRDTRAGTEIRAARRKAVYVAPKQIVQAQGEAQGAGRIEQGEGRMAQGAGRMAQAQGARREAHAHGPELIEPRHCYVCKADFTRVHFFYDAMCPDCAALNYEKRFQTAPLHGRVALITGARLKIGYHASLMMLRAGAKVIATTRFPHDAAARYAREEDFDAWKDRLEVHGLDLRHAPSVEIFARWVSQSQSRLDILINNAAQTVRRPPAFYAHLIEQESRAASELPEHARTLLRSHDECKRGLARMREEHVPHADHARAHADGGGIESNMGLATWPAAVPGIGITASAALSQIPCAFDAALRAEEAFPDGKLDADLQQVDLRKVNSWRMTLADVPTPELLEVQLVNAVAPFILCSKLKPLMMKDRTDAKHIVNVSAMEGKFARHTKTDKHPHTNMAKAALNMMTLTSAPDYAQAGIYMNAVDTGWVTDEDPAHIAQMKQDVHDFQPPLDIVDGAARVCDPFFSGLLTGEHVWGQFLKDYKPTAW